MEARMTDQLYNTRILRLAASIPHQERLADADISITKVSPICGSKITVDMKVADGKITAFGQDVRACALGQASASILGAHVIGKTAAELARARDTLRAFLGGENIRPDGDWTDYDIFTPAIPHRARHGSILLALEAASDAADKASR
jgi:NifU-like protein involved in Fe-S cluster formation